MAQWLTLFVNVSAASSTVIYSGGCVLEWLTVNAADGAITVYNNSEASGSTVATLAGSTVGTFGYGCLCGSGVTVTTAGAADITVVVDPLSSGALGTPIPAPEDDALLLESGDILLLEIGDRVLLE